METSVLVKIWGFRVRPSSIVSLNSVLFGRFGSRQFLRGTHYFGIWARNSRLRWPTSNPIAMKLWVSHARLATSKLIFHVNFKSAMTVRRNPDIRALCLVAFVFSHMTHDIVESTPKRCMQLHVQFSKCNFFEHSKKNALAGGHEIPKVSLTRVRFEVFLLHHFQSHK